MPVIAYTRKTKVSGAIKVELIENQAVLPAIRKSWLARPSLMAALELASDNRLILIVAGAGTGKTGLVSQYFSKHPEIAYGYMPLDASLAEPHAFLRRLAQSVQHLAHDEAKEILGDVIQGENFSEQFSKIFSLIPKDKPCALIFDNFDQVENSLAANELAKSFSRFIPENIRIILISRALPALRYGALTQDMGVVGQSAFKLKDEEIGQLIANALTGEYPSEALIKRVKEYASGWLTATRLYGQLLATLGSPELVEDQINGLLADYFDNEVMTYLPEDLREFARQSSVMPSINMDMASKVMSNPQPLAMINEIRRRNLFIKDQPEGDRSSITYNPLFQEFLRTSFKEKYPVEFAGIHERIAAYWVEQENPKRAITHFLYAGNKVAARDLLKVQSQTFLNKGQYEQALDLLDRSLILEDVQSGDNILAHCAIFAQLQQGNDAKASQIIDLLDKNDSTTCWLISLQTRARAYTKVIRMVELESESLFENSLPLASISGRLSLARCYLETGQLEMALQTIAKTLQMPEINDWKALYARAKIVEAETHNLRGDTHPALRASADSVAVARASEDQHMLIAALLTQARFLANEDELASGERALAEAGRLSRKPGLEHLQQQVDQTVAWFSLIGGRFDDAIMLSRRTISSYQSAAHVSNARVAARQMEALDVWRRALMMGANLRQTSNARLDELSEAEVVTKQMLEIGRHGESVIALRKALCGAGAVAAASSNFSEALSYLNEAAGLRGEFNDEIAGAVCAWQFFIENSSTEPEAQQRAANAFAQLENLFKKRERLTFLQQEGDRVWTAFARAQNFDAESRSFTETRLPAGKNRGTRLGEPSTGYVSSLSNAQRQPTALKVFGFGTGRAVINGEQVTVAQWGWYIPRELLIYMLTIREATRERIGSIFWPESSTLTMQRGFHNAKFTIRNVIGVAPFIYSNGIYTLNPALSYWYDVQEFELLLNDASRLPDEQAKPKLIQALSLYTDDFLLGSDLTWADNTRQRLRGRFLKCCIDLGELSLRINELDHNAQNALSRAFEMEPLREDIARIYMRLLSYAGKKEEAIEVYRLLSNTLKRELNVRPDSVTEKMFQDILNDGRPA